MSVIVTDAEFAALQIVLAMHLGDIPLSEDEQAAFFLLRARARVEALDRIDSPAGNGVEQIADERLRQLDKWDDAHDDGWGYQQLAEAAAIYATPSGSFRDGLVLDEWPWPNHPPTFGDRKTELVRAGALICAEIDRIDRAEA